MNRRVAGALAVCFMVAAPLGISRGTFDDAHPDRPSAPAAAAGGAKHVGSLGWMAGRWKGTLFGGPVDERWASPTGGSMLGMCRLGADASRAMYETMLIEETDAGIVLYLRHFRRGLKAAEERPLEYRLTKLEESEAVFDTSDEKLSFRRIAYRKIGKDVLEVRLEGGDKDHPRVASSRMERQTGD